jgi:PAS domain S-box-containing protein
MKDKKKPFVIDDNDLDDHARLTEKSGKSNPAVVASFAESELLNIVIENIPDQIYLKDAQSRFILCNTLVAVNAGFNSPQEMLGKTDFDCHPEEAAQFFEDEQLVINADRSLINHEESIVDKETKRVKWNLTTKVPIKNSDGDVIGLLGINRDITEIKKVAHEREELMKNLMQRNRDLEQFAYMISHNLRAPVANIIGLMELAGDDNINDNDKKKIWDGIEISVKNISSVIKELNEVLELKKDASNIY